MAYSMQFASAFIHGFVALESEVDASGLHSRSKRFVATVPVPDFEDQLGFRYCFLSQNTSFYVPGDIVYVCAKFVASTTRNMVLDTTIHHTLNFNVSNPPDPMPCLIHICGHVESVYQVLPEYGDFRGYNIKTACWTKEYNRSVDFVVRVIIAPGVRFNKTSLPQINSLINVHGILFGRDKASGLIIILLKEFSFCIGLLLPIAVPLNWVVHRRRLARKVGVELPYNSVESGRFSVESARFSVHLCPFFESVDGS
ncbi:hypothetical protein BDD12DRAFT_395491 [Trichophaea hybrida]|nr:hypothetical protein BDD12DRAFT_395491 [Trichophaea hybrida]